MEAATATLHHSYGLGPHGPSPPHGPQQAHEPQQAAGGPAGTPQPEDQRQQHQKPFFYIQASQPYLPMQGLQWPVPLHMPVGYNPYYSYPGLGYGMPVMPHYQPNPYMEPPGFVVPHTHLHLMDYRRMLNPQYYQTMAYHSRRFRYQHNGPTREVASSEVQTEPLSGTPKASTPGSSDTEASSVPPVHGSGDDAPGVATSQLISPASAGDHSVELKDTAPACTTGTPPNGSFVIQTEEVRIECRTTPAGLQLLHSHETAEVSHRFSQDLVQRRSIVQGGVLQDDRLRRPAEQAEQSLQACPDILLVGMPNSSEKMPELEEPKSHANHVSLSLDSASQVAAQGEVEVVRSEGKNTQFKAGQLPFSPKYLEELQKMESTVWSVEESLVPSTDSLIQNGLPEFDDQTLLPAAEVATADSLLLSEDAQMEEVVPMIEMPPEAENGPGDTEAMMEGPGEEMGSQADIRLMMDVPAADEAPVSEQKRKAEATPASNFLQLVNSPVKADGNQDRREPNVQDQQDTSFESLPAYLPSSSWLADFDNVHFCSRLPLKPKKQSRPPNRCGLDVPTRRRKLDMEYKEQPAVRKPKERYKPKGKMDRQSFSDHECCRSRSFNENAFTPYASKGERLCTRCLAKPRICTSASPGPDGRPVKRKAAPFQQWNDPLLPTCEACKSHSKKQLRRKGSIPDVRRPQPGADTEGESSENGWCRAAPRWHPRKPGDLKRPLASKQNLERCPTAIYLKLREKNCVCNEAQRQPVAWERQRHCPHGNAIREMDENCAAPVSPRDKWRNVDQVYLTQRWQAERSWKAVMPNPDGLENQARSQHSNKHKTSQSQGKRKDTRC